MSDIINNLLINKKLEFWKSYKFTELINQYNKLYHDDDKNIYNACIAIIKSSKNYTAKVRNYIRTILGDNTLHDKQYEIIWKEFVHNFEKSERLLIVNEIMRIINEKTSREELTISRNHEEDLQKENEKLQKQLARMQKKIAKLRHVLTILHAINQ